MVPIKTSEKLNRWKGTTTELAETVRLATGLIAHGAYGTTGSSDGIGDDAESFHRLRRVIRSLLRQPRLSRCGCAITVAEARMERTFEGPDHFKDHIDTGNLGRIQTIRASIDSGPRQNFGAVITWSAASPAVTVDVRGTNSTAVEGISRQLYDRLNEGRRANSALLGTLPLVIGGAVVAAWFVGVFVWESAPDVYYLGGVVAGLFVWVPSLVLSKLVPTLELLPTGRRSRWERWRKWFLGVVYSGFALTAAAVLTIVVTNAVS